MSEFLPGVEVEARGLRWEVVFAERLGLQTLYRLRGLEGAVRGQELDLLHPFEPLQRLVHDFQPDKAAPLRHWLVYHQAFLLEQALGADALLAVQPGRLRLEPYQLVPVLRAIRISRPRLLLADGVGLGKTIQAGLILTELLARRVAHRILIVSPAGPLLEQWKTEMAERFGLHPDVIDRGRLEEIRKATELGANPFDHIPLGLASIDFLKQERVLDQLERSNYDVVIIDEAHHCMDLGAAGEREDSQRRRLAQVLARRGDALLLLTATPHDSHDHSFASLCELLDPALVDGHGALRGTRYRAHVVRRLKRHIKDPRTGKDLFRERLVLPIAVLPEATRHPHFFALQHTLLDLIAPELRRAFRARRYSDVLSFIALLKRSVSTVAACQSTLAVVAERFQTLLTESAENQEGRRQRLRTLREYQHKLERFGTTTAEEEAERQRLEAEDLAQRLADLQREVRAGSRSLKRTADVIAALDDLVSLAEVAAHEDPKLHQLVAEIAAIRREEPGANVMVYTEYTTSQQAAAEALHTARLEDVLTMSGDDPEAARQAITERFRSQDGLILVSTDTAAEGLNLQERCHHLIHLELPFNPNRLEQRNGRIDRYGQTHNPIVRYLYLRGTFEERILLRLIAKYERQRARLTFVPNTLGLTTASDTAAERLLQGLLDEDSRLLQPDGTLFDFTHTAEADGADEATHELLAEIDRSLTGFERATHMHAWLGDAGLHAEEQLLHEANAARGRGDRCGAVDLARFTTEAILLDGGSVVGGPLDAVFEVLLPPSWLHGLEDLPGYDPQTRRVRLTTRLEVTCDAHGRPVGFLGRAHPLVRRALERVRHLSFGAEARSGQDPRVSAVSADVSQPTLLYTFLGRVTSQAGREFERVLAVETPAVGEPRFHDTPDAWLWRADPACAMRTAGVWEQFFASWADQAQTQAHHAAAAGFTPLAEAFMAQRHQALEAEREVLQQWLAQRAREITGDLVLSPQQRELFAQRAVIETPAGSPAPAWALRTDPAERLAAFAADTSQTPARRSEADGVLRLHRQRLERLEAQLALSAPEVVPLGVLMLVPQGCGDL
jgi:superfamily II DNA or RNA helicase